MEDVDVAFLKNLKPIKCDTHRHTSKNGSKKDKFKVEFIFLVSLDDHA